MGYDIQRLSPATNDTLQILQFLKHFEIDVVFDVGANKGQFSHGLRTFGFKGDIVSFEPLPDAHKILLERSAGDAKWSVHPQSAIGDYDGEVVMNISENSHSSSILPILLCAEESVVGSTC